MPKTIECADCGQVKTIHARGLCQKCYDHGHHLRRSQARREAAEARKRARIQYVIGEVEFLAGTDSRENLANRLGYASQAGLRDFLERYDRLDLWEAMAA